MSFSKCCFEGFQWEGTPTGRTAKLATNDVYITGDNSKTAILFIADLFGWTFPNIRLLADHFAREIGATVYVPDFFGGEVLDFDLICQMKFEELDVEGFVKWNSREIREPEIFACARAIREEHSYEKVGAVGYCYGAWACFRLGAKEHAEAPLVDAISFGHPSLLTKKDIGEVDVPVQILAPEIDPAYSVEMKRYTFDKLMELNLPFDYQHFPKVVHACFIRGDENTEGERAAMVRAKNATVAWFRQFLKE